MGIMSQKGINSKNAKKLQLLQSQRKLLSQGAEETSKGGNKISVGQESDMRSAQKWPPKVGHASLLNGKYFNMLINASGDQIFAHTYVIEARCKGLISKILTKKHKKNGVYIYESKQYEASFLKELVKYLYSDEANFANLSLVEVVFMIQVSTDHNIPRLKQMSKKHLGLLLTLDNIYDALYYSHRLNVKEAEDVCMNFAVRNHEAFIMNPILTEKLRDVALLQKETILYSQMCSNAAVTKDTEIQIPPSTIVSDFKNLFESGIGSDISIVTVEGVIPCHRAIIANASPIFADLVDVCPKDQPLTFPDVIQPVHSDICYMLLRYIYYGGVNFDSKEATQLIVLAKKLQVQGIVSHCQTCILANVNKDTISYSLQVAFDPIFDDQPEFQAELKDICQRVLFDNFDSIDFSLLQNMHPVVSSYLLISLQRHLESISFKPGLPSPIKLPPSTYPFPSFSPRVYNKTSQRHITPVKLADSSVSQDVAIAGDAAPPESPSANSKSSTSAFEKTPPRDRGVSLQLPQEQDERKSELNNRNSSAGGKRKPKAT
ncbi:uncharacterized protein LOC126317499 [Schistocerca gregaria]|uniref:uncharacterized protein LOC126317499 n=1 Tax=Schistocerca gregaria TaxID=7010 RepID=UPI00211E93A1|nr:uncharacterized protein LOC126317499 [Schistocerca gregaria]XP_049849127.1 uncharacterized protein LOC126317499 [Schistocerca gregaria]XP_049849128.1 uncharacterized protein LOC126317499 [Schistocerca gregaria]